jgi:hypothetical protein
MELLPTSLAVSDSILNRQSQLERDHAGRTITPKPAPSKAGRRRSRVSEPFSEIHDDFSSKIQMVFALQVLVSIGVSSTHHGKEYFCFENRCRVHGKNVIGEHNEVRQLSRRQ